ncbi:MAG: hypothetical protein CMN82_07605 [Spongiibacter sp.]|nr:hypothetical protein [Spongiibacter sp.]MBI58840.1 hypothetical protein [Spongiibacter sp.]|tara:strand:- start:279 stop:497 length:219 start_codon:yes stop_codon:yes gene_type:complete
MAQVVAVCDGNWVTSGALTGNHLICDGTLTQAAWPPPSLLPPLSIAEAGTILTSAAVLWALAWAFTKIRAVM